VRNVLGGEFRVGNVLTQVDCPVYYTHVQLYIDSYNVGDST